MKYLTICIFFLLYTSSVHAETWKEECNTCTGDRDGFFMCTALYCGDTDIDNEEKNSKDFDKGFNLGLSCMTLLALELKITDRSKTFGQMEKICRDRFKVTKEK